MLQCRFKSLITFFSSFFPFLFILYVHEQFSVHAQGLTLHRRRKERGGVGGGSGNQRSGVGFFSGTCGQSEMSAVTGVLDN